MNVWFAERRYALPLEARADVPHSGISKVVEVPVEYLYIPAHGAFSAPYDVVHAEWRDFSNDDCLMRLFEDTISGKPTTLRSLRSFDMPEADVRDLLDIGNAIRSLDTMFRRKISSVSLKKIIQEYF